MFSLPVPKIIRSFRSSITIHITRDGELVVRAPHLVPQSQIEKLLSEKQEWILKSLEKVGKKKQQVKQFIDGEEFFYLGKQYLLKLGDFKEIHVTETMNFPRVLLFRAKKEIEIFYMRAAREKITQRVEHHAKIIGTSYKKIMFSDTSSKWGTCGPDNSLQFNWRLIMAPILVIDYVVIHELAHTIEKNHSRDFWSIVRKYTPAFRQHRKWLNDHGHLLMF